jgi:AraC family transcriptional regulator
LSWLSRGANNNGKRPDVQIGYVYIRPVEALYVRALGPYKTAAASAWSDMLAWLDERQLRGQIARGFGIINDDPQTIPAELRRYDACVEAVAGLDVDAAAGIGRLTVPGGAYIVHRHVGRHRMIGAGFSYIHRKWVPGHGLRVDKRRPYLEIYLNDPATTPQKELLTDLCVPVFPVDELMEHERYAPA